MVILLQTFEYGVCKTESTDNIATMLRMSPLLTHTVTNGRHYKSPCPCAWLEMVRLYIVCLERHIAADRHS